MAEILIDRPVEQIDDRIAIGRSGIAIGPPDIHLAHITQNSRGETMLDAHRDRLCATGGAAVCAGAIAGSANSKAAIGAHRIMPPVMPAPSPRASCGLLRPPRISSDSVR
ncbi:hypothetical protein ASE90_18025 [Sphingomonas sp. Leaf67]|nr:hypothetical protein [Sphingomonas sp. Leaf67]KQN89929.1 hypothetical protein ASE90_18025 [Sphingomonas sp. Leaf67]